MDIKKIGETFTEIENMTIYTEKDEPLWEALTTMTDFWLEDGNYSEQTIFDMRDILLKLADLKTEIMK